MFIWFNSCVNELCSLFWIDVDLWDNEKKEASTAASILDLNKVTERLKNCVDFSVQK